MGLAESQALLARLVTDASLRTRLDRDPHAVVVEFGLSPGEAAQLETLPSRQLARFAVALRSKRILEVKKLLPLSLTALGDVTFARLFDEHAAGFVPAGVHKHREDALAFAERAEHAVRSGQARPDWAADALRYEAAHLRAAAAGRCCIVRRLRHAPAEMAAHAGSPERALVVRWALAVWLRLTPAGRLRHAVIAWPRASSAWKARAR